MESTTIQASALEQPRPLSFLELRANATNGMWDQARLAAKFFVAKVAGTAHEFFVDLPTAIFRDNDPISYHIEKSKRDVVRLREIGTWAVKQEIVTPGAKASLPKYQRLI